MGSVTATLAHQVQTICLLSTPSSSSKSVLSCAEEPSERGLGINYINCFSNINLIIFRSLTSFYVCTINGCSNNFSILYGPMTKLSLQWEPPFFVLTNQTPILGGGFIVLKPFDPSHELEIIAFEIAIFWHI